jgi:hypothetical protein
MVRWGRGSSVVMDWGRFGGVAETGLEAGDGGFRGLGKAGAFDAEELENGEIAGAAVEGGCHDPLILNPQAPDFRFPFDVPPQWAASQLGPVPASTSTGTP